MKSIIGIFNNSFYFKVVATLIFLISTTRYTENIYNYGIYIIVVWGCFLLIKNNVEKKINYKKIDILILLFSIGYFITIIINRDENIMKQVFVFLSCLMYFFSFFSVDGKSTDEFNRENKIIMLMIIICSFVIILVSYAVLFYDISNGLNHSYNLHGGNRFQFIGIYNGISTQAVISGTSALCSLQFIVLRNKYFFKYKRVFVIFNIINFIIQDISLTISYTTASIVAFGVALAMGVYVIFITNIYKKSIIKYFFIMLITIVIVCSNYLIMDFCGSKFINDNFKKVEADDASKELFSSNGRLKIWEAAIEQWEEAPVFGIGYGNFYVEIPVDDDEIDNLKYRNCHSGYIEVLNACGIWGFLTIMVFGAYYLFIFFKKIFTDKSSYIYLGVAMIIIHSCLYAAINQLFVLDRSLSVFLIFVFLGAARKFDCQGETELRL